jgi:hypothetical protein
MAVYPHAESLPGAVDYKLVLKHNYGMLARWLIVRLVIVAVLIAGPLVADHAFDVTAGWTIIPLVAGAGLLIWTLPRIGCGVRLAQCARVLRNYPLEHRPALEKTNSEWDTYSTVHTVRMRTGDTDSEPEMWAINACGSRKWPEGTENGVWFAGDEPFGGVLVVPGSNGLMFLNPADWENEAARRAEAGPERTQRARSAKLHKRNWRKPKYSLGA